LSTKTIGVLNDIQVIQDVDMKTLTLLKVIFSAIGAGLLALGVYLGQSTHRFVLKAQQLDGEVIDLLPVSSHDRVTYKPLVRFMDGQGQAHTFQSAISSNPPSYAVGEHVVVLNDPHGDGNPKIRSLFSLWGGAVIAGALGCVFLGMGGGVWAYGEQQRKKEQHLLQQGQVIEADVQGVELNEAVSINGRNPYVLRCQWLNPQTREVHVFQSGNVWFDPTEHLDRDKVRVYVEAGNLRNYLVDLSFLPKLGR
jgi:hypothetical protein